MSWPIEIRAPDDGSWHGAATYFFLETVRDWQPGLTWAAVHDQVLARVHTIYPAQSPQLEGEGGRALFGAVVYPVERYLRVLAMPDDLRVQIDGGSAIGLAVGASLAIYAPGAPLKGRPLALATVEKVQMDEALAKLERPGPVAPGSRAQILAYGYRDQAHWVAVDDARVVDRIVTARDGQPSPFLRVVSPGADQTPEFAVKVIGDRYILTDATGERIVDAMPPCDEHGAAAVVVSLEHLAIFRNVLALRNPSASPSLQNALEVVEARVSGAAPGSMPLTAQPGQTIEFRLLNKTNRTLFVTVFRLGADFSVRRIRPERGRNETLAPGRAAALRVADALALVDPAHTFERIIYKVFVLTDPVDLDVLELPALNKGALHTGPDVRSGSPLADLLNGVRHTGTRPLRLASDTVDSKWHTFSLEVDVVN